MLIVSYPASAGPRYGGPLDDPALNSKTAVTAVFIILQFASNFQSYALKYRRMAKELEKMPITMPRRKSTRKNCVKLVW